MLTFGRKLDKPRGVRLREALEELGPIFVKFGRDAVYAQRPDAAPMWPRNWPTAGMRVPPFDSQIAVDTIERSAPRSRWSRSSSASSVSVASASIAQVHFARVRDKSGVEHDVAVKVLRPGMKSRDRQGSGTDAHDGELAGKALP